MEVFLLIMVILIFALSFLFHIITNLVKELKSGKSTKLSNGFEAKLSVIPISKQKSEVSAHNTTSQTKPND